MTGKPGLLTILKSPETLKFQGVLLYVNEDFSLCMIRLTASDFFDANLLEVLIGAVII